MKRVLKQNEPNSLQRYRHSAPDSTWRNMKDDPHHGGPTAYTDSRTQLIADQKRLCAYCEIDISGNDPLRCRIEHFHPKSDITPAHNWALDWHNLLAVCAGGSNRHDNAPYTHEPLAKNLSCDAHKDQMIQSGRLQEACEGWVLNPLLLQASPCIIKLEKSTGKILPDAVACAAAPQWPNSQHENFQQIVQHTIDMLNLNCDRLCQARLVVSRGIERNKKKERTDGRSAKQGFNNLFARYFQREWPSFFSTVRLSLGPHAEAYLTARQYQG